MKSWLIYYIREKLLQSFKMMHNNKYTLYYSLSHTCKHFIYISIHTCIYMHTHMNMYIYAHRHMHIHHVHIIGWPNMLRESMCIFTCKALYCFLCYFVYFRKKTGSTPSNESLEGSLDTLQHRIRELGPCDLRCLCMKNKSNSSIYMRLFICSTHTAWN